MSEAAVTPVFDLHGLEVTLGGRRVLGPLDLEVAAGSFLGILGPNGSGKTTLVRIMALYEHPTSGSVEILGGRLGTVDVRRLRARIGYASAALADQLRPSLSAHDVVKTARYAALEPWWHRYTADDDARAHECLARMGMGSFAERTFGSLSSGEQQRVLLARTLINDPGVVLLDEPSARLDLAGREELISTLGSLAADPSTPPSVLVTHHVNEIPPGTTHVLLLRDGRAITEGPIDLLTSASLSECFALEVDLQRHANGRFTAWAVR